MDNEVAEVSPNRPRKVKFLVIISAALCFLGLLFMFISNGIIGNYGKYMLNPNEPSLQTSIGIVFGAGVDREGQPFQELQARLDDAAEALKANTIQKILLSGDNRFEDYNEPDAMVRYLTEEKGIDSKLLQPDYAGRSTYETCERAKKVFSADQAILFSADSHLPRAIYTCRKFGVDAYGIGNNKEANNAKRREFLARTKAIFNIYIVGEETILGDKIDF